MMKNLFFVTMALVVLGSVTSSSSASATLFGVNGDVAYPGDLGVPGSITSAKNLTGTSLTFVLDMGIETAADDIMLRHRTDAATNLAIKTLNIYVAPDESAGGFDATDIASYTTLVGGGSTASNAAGLETYFAITPSEKRYYMIEVTEGWFGSIGTDQGNQWVHLNDLQAVPEPASLVLLGMGSLVLCRNKRKK